jgi:hypothetical protein
MGVTSTLQRELVTRQIRFLTRQKQPHWQPSDQGKKKGVRKLRLALVSNFKIFFFYPSSQLLTKSIDS